ncbi:leucine transcriptional activator [Escherichia coli]|nr:leucine transcriptional activator [Escherichia coli]
MFAGKKSAQIREILISESAWEEMTCLFAPSLELQVLPLPLKQNSRTCYLSWHEAAGRDKGHQWMEEQLVSICKR